MIPMPLTKSSILKHTSSVITVEPDLRCPAAIGNNPLRIYHQELYSSGFVEYKLGIIVGISFNCSLIYSTCSSNSCSLLLSDWNRIQLVPSGTPRTKSGTCSNFCTLLRLR